MKIKTDYDCLSDLLTDELRDRLRAIDFAALPRERDGLRLVCLRNDHLHAKCGLILPELPAEAAIPHCYGGEWRKPFADLAAEPTRFASISADPVVVRFSRCRAIYA